MATRKSLGIKIYLSYELATGVVNYWINLVRALNVLPDNQKPHIVIFHTNRAPIHDIKIIEYPYIEFFNVSVTFKPAFFKRAINKISRYLLKKNIFQTSVFFNKKVNTLLDFYYADEQPVYFDKKINWVCDFQHRYFPDNFPYESYVWNEEHIGKAVQKKECVLLSSNDAKRDFDKFYHHHKCEVKILQFSTILPKEFYTYKSNSEYIGANYFIVSNQFWPHKNHITVVKAVAELKKLGLDVLVLFTGHLSDRDPTYAARIKKVIHDNNLEDSIKFLGFIDRLEQLKLIENSVAVIQPTLFEGWSTVVEDCRALGKFVILSDLRVNKEQITKHCIFFEATNYVELANCMKSSYENPMENIPTDNQALTLNFANKILNTFELN